MSQSKLDSETVARSGIYKVLDLFKKGGRVKFGELRENELRDIYEAALKTPGSREITVEEAEEFIRPYESASDALKSEIEKSLPSKP